MELAQHATLRVHRDGGTARITLDNPPVNVLDVAMMRDLHHVLTELRHDDSTRVIVLDSADPDYFVAHVDMSLVDAPEAADAPGTPDAPGGLLADTPEGLNVFQALGELLRTQPQVTIVELAGIARGGGAELVAAADMAFAAIGRAGLGQVEALMGIVPGGGGTQYLLNRVGRNRALEIVLAADLFDAETAERYGWVNRAVPAQELSGYVRRVASNIAALPEGVVAAAKQALPVEDLAPGMLREHRAWQRQFVRPAAERLIRGGLSAGAQTREGERDLEGLLRALAS